MKTIPLSLAVLFALAFISALLPSCAGLEIVTHTPYGNASYKDGVGTYTPPEVAPGPIRFPIHGTK